jgi:hypothetical protein
MQTYVRHEILIHFCVQVGMCIISNMQSVHTVYIVDNTVIY